MQAGACSVVPTELALGEEAGTLEVLELQKIASRLPLPPTIVNQLGRC